MTQQRNSDDYKATGEDLVLRRTIRAPAVRLFAAWVEPARLMEWWGPAPDVKCIEAGIDLRVGGLYRIANRMPDGVIILLVGEFLVIELPRRLTYSWRVEPGGRSTERVTVRFEPRGLESTDVVIVHQSIPDRTLREKHELGWHGCLDGLAAYSTRALRP
jgi:uncharacterized protein YndB with AHSA1/START domain